MMKLTFWMAVPALLLSGFTYACEHGDHWKNADADKDGKVSRAEAEKAAPRMAQGFDRVDADGDGQLTEAELHAARDGWRDKHRGDLRDQFEAADKDGDKALNLAEAQVAFPRMAEDFSKLDTNNDGKVTPEELRARHKRM
jgi:Ca2+-binding EF-hand superfamily protein